MKKFFCNTSQRIFTISASQIRKQQDSPATFFIEPRFLFQRNSFLLLCLISILFSNLMALSDENQIGRKNGRYSIFNKISKSVTVYETKRFNVNLTITMKANERWKWKKKQKASPEILRKIAIINVFLSNSALKCLRHRNPCKCDIWFFVCFFHSQLVTAERKNEYKKKQYQRNINDFSCALQIVRWLRFLFFTGLIEVCFGCRCLS